MEKISEPLLVKHLSDCSGFYNQLYRDFELRYGVIDHSIIASWIVNTIEPVIKNVSVSYPNQLHQIFNSFYTELLQILGNRSGIVYEKEYRTAWELCNKVLPLVAVYPSRLLKAIDSALESLINFQPDKVLTWISLMDNTTCEISSIDEFLACGRVYAWLCGLAHLRDRAKTEFFNLRSELKQTIETIHPFQDRLETIFCSEWPNLLKAKFVGQSGGYIGFGGPFIAPPLVAKIGNEILATDKKNCCAFYADCFGIVLLYEIPISPVKIVQESGIKKLDNIKWEYGRKLISFDDITSFAVKNSTLVLTRASSHYLFVYGQPL